MIYIDGEMVKVTPTMNHLIPLHLSRHNPIQVMARGLGLGVNILMPVFIQVCIYYIIKGIYIQRGMYVPHVS